ncbi:MAG: response regulator transcription factor [Cyanosarcina radialis HA8281-LM2]|nr:response regulator transcription factor [Cyanosarcina radialis HA8281-LM2]
MVRVLIADDHPVVLQGLSAILEQETDMAIVGQAQNGVEAVKLYRHHQPDVMLMDLRMPEMDGVAAIAAICAEFDRASIVVLTTFDGDEDIHRGLQAGAKGYLLKDAGAEELLAAIRTVFKGQKYISPAIGAKLAERTIVPELSDRELEVLQLMAKGKSNRDIGATLHITENTVKFHVNHILGKLGVSDRVQAVLVALKRGITSV